MPDAHPSGHRRLLLLALFGAALFLTKMHDGILLEDHARYAAVAKSIVVTGDWVTMHETPERPYFNKPPLVFWLTAILYELFGVSTWAARFWSSLAGVGTVLLVYDVGRRLWGERAGLAAGLVLALTNDFLRYSAVGRLDAPQTFCFTLLLWGLVRAAWPRVVTDNPLAAVDPAPVAPDRDEEATGPALPAPPAPTTTELRSAWLVVPGIAVGLGLLAKGPPVLALLAAAVLIALLTGRGKAVLTAGAFWGGLVLGVLLAAPWHLAVAAENPGFWDHYVGHEMVSRLEGDWKAGDPRWQYLLVLLEHSLPWTPLYLAGLWGAWRQARAVEPGSADGGRRGDAAVLLCVWLAVAAAVAFAPPRMYGRYLVPLYPPLALAAGVALARGLPAQAFDHLERRLWVYAVVLALLIELVPFDRHQSDEKTAILRAAPLLREAYEPDEAVAVYLTEIHAPAAVVFFYTDRESVIFDAPAAVAAAAPPLVLTSKGGLAALAPYGYTERLRSDKLVLAARTDAEPVTSAPEGHAP